MLSHKQQVLLNTITKLLRKNAHRRVRDIIHKVHTADLAIIFEFLNESQHVTIFNLLTDNQKRVELLEYLEGGTASKLIKDYSAYEIAELVNEMSTDDATDLIQEFEEAKVQEILSLLKKDDREDFEELMAYEDDTAGGLMATDFLSITADTPIHKVLEQIQASGDDAEMVFYIYAIDEDGRLVGVASLREIVQADENQLLEDIMETDIYKAKVNMDQEEVAHMISQYDLLAVPVVDDENIIIGIVTVDDIIDVIREENTEDMLRLIGADEDLFDDYSVKRNIISRFPWLLATWFGGIVVMKLVGAYEDQLKQFVALTAFFPVILGMSGNVGQQSATIIVRGLAIGKVDVSRLASTVGKEALTGLVIGLIYGLALAGAAWFEFGAEVAMIPIVVGLSQCAGMTVAAMAGALFPMLLTRLDADPAVATGPLVTTSLDLIGMWIYIAFATLFIF